MADKHHISHRGLTEVITAVIHFVGGSINDLSLSKDTVRRHCNKIREHKAKSICQTNIKAIKTSENNKYLLHWDGKMLHGLEHVETSSEVVAILLTATHRKREILLKIENGTEGHITAAQLTKIILETMDMWNIEKHSIIGLVLDTTSVNTGVHKGVAVSLERTCGGNLLQLACRHHALELLCGAAASTIFSKTKSPNEAAFEILLDRWPVLDKVDNQVKKAICRNEKVQHANVISFCLAALCDDIC